MRRTRVGVTLLALAVLRNADCAAQSSLWVTAPGCEDSTGFNVVHGNLLVTGASVACEYDATTLALVRTIPLPGPAVATRVVEGPGDDFFLAGAGPGVHLIDGPTGAVVQTYVDPSPPDTSFGWDIAVSGSRLLVAEPAAISVHVFDVATGAFQHTITFSEANFGDALAVVGPDVVVRSANTQTRLRRYDVATGAFLGEFPLLPPPGSVGGRMAAAGSEVLIGIPGVGTAYLLNGTTGAVVRTFTPPDPVIAFGFAVRATATQVLVYAFHGPDVVYVYDRATGTLLRTIPYVWPRVGIGPRENVAVLGARTIAGETVAAYCGGTAGCGPCETCGPSGTCVAAPHPTCQQMGPSEAFKLMFQSSGTSDTVLWKGKGQLAPGGPPDTGQEVFATPNDETDYALCVFDPSSALLFRAEAPAEACGAGTCWKQRSDLFAPRITFAYRDPDRTPDGIRGGRLSRRADTGLTTLQLRGNGPNLSSRPFGIPTLPLTLPLRVQLQSRDGQCFETNHSTTVSNSPQRFISKSD